MTDRHHSATMPARQTPPARPVTRRAVLAATLAPGASAGALAGASAAASATPLRISVAQFPSGVTERLTEALTIAFGKLPEVSVQFSTAPFPRSVALAISGEVDLHVPMIRPPAGAVVPWTPSTATIYHVPFVLYTNKSKPITLNGPGNYAIESESVYLDQFDFHVFASVGAESSLRKVDSGRIDGYVFAGTICDPLIVALDLKNIHRTLYKRFESAGALPKGGADGPADRLLTRAMAAVADDAGFARAIGHVLSGYKGDDWQP